ncbi:MAG: DUF4097 family beta strand repeat protein [Acidobacteriota bacterium]|nr:DUF4097 family beta strand repeat protein [Acidobacteriota bacterium]
MRNLWIAATVLAMAALPALAAEATFERNLTVNGRVDLTVSTGSGKVHLTRGAGNQMHIVGHVRSGWGGSDARVHEIAANPPIEQTGNIIRIGAHHWNLNNVSIEYEIQAPADAFLEVSSGSGDITVEGVGDNAKISTGSGSIRATGLHAGFTISTGSGDIYAEQNGTGDVRAKTGSGTIELRNLNGGLRADTGSGDIKVAGTPANPWHLQTGSGSVELSPGNTGFDLDASTGSGSIRTDREMMTHGMSDRHHVTGKISGGGPTVRIETGSGDIRVH